MDFSRLKLKMPRVYPRIGKLLFYKMQTQYRVKHMKLHPQTIPRISRLQSNPWKPKNEYYLAMEG